MKRRNSIVVGVALLAALIWGCGEDGPGGGDPAVEYPEPTSPENVLSALQASYQRREIEEYAKLLAPDFRFCFQLADIPPDLEREYWNRDEDSTGTGALFGATAEVSSIALDLGAFTVEDSVRVEQPDVKRIRLTHAKLELELFSGTTLLVQGDIQDMYFRQGSAAAGTDSTKWYLFEWHDLAGGGSLKPASGVSDPASGLAGSNVHVLPTTWGSIKALF